MQAAAAFSLSALVFTAAAQADTFGTGTNTFKIEFVTVGHPGNSDDPLRSIGKVDYDFRMAKHEVSEDMIDKANAEGGLTLTHQSRGANKPATQVSWYEAVAFTNWLNTSTGRLPAYKFDDAGNFHVWEPGDIGYDPENIYRNRLAKYFLPSSDEWHKAAYYDPAMNSYHWFPTGGNTVPARVTSGTAPGSAVYDLRFPFPSQPADVTQAGGLSPNGTMAQGGNVEEWQEAYLYRDNDPDLEIRGHRGGAMRGTLCQ